MESKDKDEAIYKELIKRFWKANDTERKMNTATTGIYFYLLHICYNLGWKDEFEYPMNEIQWKYRLTKDKIQTAKNNLQACRLVEFEDVVGSKTGMVKVRFNFSK